MDYFSDGPSSLQTVRMGINIAVAGLLALAFLGWFAMTHPLASLGIAAVAAAIIGPIVFHSRRQAARMRALAAESDPVARSRPPAPAE